ncbi:MAG: pentapeptide repeat-containing protein [Coleofasciculaceae cyanobacterium]
MPDKQHYNYLRQGIKVWNQWRAENLDIRPELERLIFRFDLSGVNFSDANLIEANLNTINLSQVNFEQADLNRAKLKQVNLSGANLSGANLRLTDLRRANLRDANLKGCKLGGANLSGADLRGADLGESDLTVTNLNSANLSQVNLTRAKLIATQALDTNFHGAILTETEIENWQISETTQFEEVTCHYFYRKINQQQRHPQTGKLAQGEFEKLFQLTTTATVPTQLN